MDEPINEAKYHYFTAVEEHFCQLRGGESLLLPADWAVIELWAEMNIPLDIALAGMAEAFKSNAKIITLFECQPFVISRLSDAAN